MNSRLALVIALVVTACTPPPPGYTVVVSGLGASPEPVRYLILPLLQGVDSNDLQFQEARKYLKAALDLRGFTQAPTADQADVAVFLAYGIGAPETHSYAYTMPVIGQTAGGRTTISGTTLGTGGSAVTTGTVTTAPQYGVVGSQVIAGEYTTYTRFALVSGVDLGVYRASGQIKEIWRTTMLSTGTSGDLRLLLPVLFAAGSPFLGANTGNAVVLMLRDTDPRVVRMRSLP